MAPITTTHLVTYDFSPGRGLESLFSVPTTWLESKIDCPLDEWLDSYTFDDSLEIKRLAKEENVFAKAKRRKGEMK